MMFSIAYGILQNAFQKYSLSFRVWVFHEFNELKSDSDGA
jgi:hypothetical protein